MNKPRPTQTMGLRLESLAASSREESFWAAPSSVRARISSRSVTVNGVVEYWSDGIGAEEEDEKEEEDDKPAQAGMV
jgi:hypothetical protein